MILATTQKPSAPRSWRPSSGEPSGRSSSSETPGRRGDSTYAAPTAQSSLSKPKVYARLASLECGAVAALGRLVKTRHHHVKAHDGHPWNELADAAASAASRGHFSTMLPSPPCCVERQLDNGGTMAEWWSLAFASLHTRDSYPPIDAYGNFRVAAMAGSSTLTLPHFGHRRALRWPAVSSVDPRGQCLCLSAPPALA